MSKVTINNKEYEFDALPDKAKANLVSLQFVQNNLKRLEAELAVFKTSEAAYSKALEAELN